MSHSSPQTESKSLIQFYESDQAHRDIINRLADLFPALGRQAIYLYYSKLLVKLGTIDWPNEQKRILEELERNWGDVASPYVRKVGITYESKERPGESIHIGVKDGKLSIDIKQADDSPGEDFSVTINPENPDDNKIEAVDNG